MGINISLWVYFLGCLLMTRINIVPVEELHNKHLLAEYKEITRVFTHVRKAQAKGKNKWNIERIDSYRMGKGHETFFFTRLKWVLRRYSLLNEELIRRDTIPTPLRKIS